MPDISILESLLTPLRSMFGSSGHVWSGYKGFKSYKGMCPYYLDLNTGTRNYQLDEDGESGAPYINKNRIKTASL